MAIVNVKEISFDLADYGIFNYKKIRSVCQKVRLFLIYRNLS